MLYLTPAFTVYCCFVAALLGACMGSFLNCMAWRVVHGNPCSAAAPTAMCAGMC